MPKTYVYESCSKKYTTDSSLRRPYRKYTEHRPQGGDIVAPAKEQVQRFLQITNLKFFKHGGASNQKRS